MSDDSTIAPALTPEEWASFTVYDGFTRVDAQFAHRLTLRMDDGSHVDLAGARHGIAALCLYGHPFGFDAEELNPPACSIVEALRETADAIDVATGTKMIGVVHVAGPSGDAMIGAYYAEMFRGLADRIAALLPPDPSR